VSYCTRRVWEKHAKFLAAHCELWFFRSNQRFSLAHKLQDFAGDGESAGALGGA
jgi:hypothetical protein